MTFPRVFAVALMSGLLYAPLSCEPAAAQPASQPGPSVAPTGAVVHRVLKRNPFAPPDIKDVPPKPPDPVDPGPKNPPGNKETRIERTVAVVQPPNFTLVGIVSSGSSNFALIQSGAKAETVTEGSLIGGYKVTDIRPEKRLVQVSKGGKTFPLRLRESAVRGAHN